MRDVAQGRSCSSCAASIISAALTSPRLSMSRSCTTCCAGPRQPAVPLDTLLCQLCGDDAQLLDAITQDIKVFLDREHRVFDLP